MPPPKVSAVVGLMAALLLAVVLKPTWTAPFWTLTVLPMAELLPVKSSVPPVIVVEPA